MPLYCPSCGQSHEETESYCHQCGQPLAQGDPLARSAPPLEDAAGTARKPWGGRQVTAGIFLVAAGSLGLLALLALPLQGVQHDVAIFAWVSSHVVGLAILVVVWWLGLRHNGPSLASLGITPVGRPRQRVVLMTLGVLGASLGATIVYGLIVNMLGLKFLAPPDIPSGIVFPGAAGILTFEALSLWTPITEEIFFRGFVFGGLTHRWGAAPAMIISAAVFSAFHLFGLALGVLVPVFITGLLLAWLYHRTGSLWPSVVAHAGQNTTALLVTIFGV